MRIELMLVSLLVLTGCSENVHYVTPPTNIVAVYYHEGNKYSVTTNVGNVLTTKRVTTRARVHTTIITDVTFDKPMWYECDYTYNNFVGATSGKGCTIHIHSVDDIIGAAWNHGKFGSGTTNRVR